MVIGCLRLSDVSVICRDCQPASKVAENLGGSCAESTAQRNDFELISTVEMETRNPVDGYFGSEFPAICNHCEFMAA